MATSLIQSSVSGNLTWLNIGDNSFKSEFAQFALNDLIKGATQLTYLNISDIGYDNEDAAETLKSAIEESSCKGTLEHLDWSYDACDMDDFIPKFLALFTQEEFPELKCLELAETLESVKKRNKWRRHFNEMGVKMIFSDRQKHSEDPEEEKLTSTESSGDDKD